MAYFNLNRNYTFNDLEKAYKQAIKKYHPIRTKTSTHLYKINSEYNCKKNQLKFKEYTAREINIEDIERAICQCGHHYDIEDENEYDIIECGWCSLKVKVVGKRRLE